MLNLARRRVSEAWWDNLLSLANSGDCPVAFEEPDPLLAGSAPELISGLEAELSITLALLFLSNSIIPGKGKSFESIYFDRSLVGWAGNGEVLDFDEDGGNGDAETGEEFDVCSAGWFCWDANTPSLSVLPLVKLVPLSRLMLESVLSLGRPPTLLVRDLRPFWDVLLLNAPLTFPQYPPSFRLGVVSEVILVVSSHSE